MGRRGAALAAALAVVALLAAPVHAERAAPAEDCVPVTTSWAEAPVTQPAALDVTHCVVFGGEPGQVVWPEIEHTYEIRGTGEVVDATGAAACPPVDDEVCTLTGTPPYRFLTTGPDRPYRVAVRDVSGMMGCPAVRPAAFGTEPADDHPGIGCRRLVAPREGRYVVRTSRGWNPPVRATTGEPLDCSGPEGTPDVCALGGDDHLLVADPLGGTFRTAFHRTDGRGCGTHAGPGIARQVEGRATRAKVDCVTLDHPRDAVVDVLGEVWSRGPDIAVLDADGRAICELWPDAPDACRLTGPGPHRALLMNDQRTRYRLVLPRLDEPVGCERLPRRADATGQRLVTLRVPRGRVATCLTAPSRFLLGTSLFGVRRLAGDSPARLTVRDTTDGHCVDADDARSFVFECRFYRPVGRTTSIVLTTDGSGGRWRLAHRFITRQE